MKKKIGAFLSTIITIVLTIAVLAGLTWVVERKQSYTRIKPFFDEARNYDVLFLGTSHMIDGVYPMQLWNDYGISSYNLGGNANTMALTYWTMRNALDYTTPKVVVLDCLQLRVYGKVNSEKLNNYHDVFDSFPLSPNKIFAATDLFHESSDEAEFLWDFIQYHSRWSNLSASDLNPQKGTTKGAEIKIGVKKPPVYKTMGDDNIFMDDTNGVKYLEKIIEECQSMNIQVLLTYIPYSAQPTYQAEANRAALIAETKGVNYINFLKLPDVVDLEIDSFDNTHLNSSGARKVTDYLGRYLMTNYNLSDHCLDPEYASWIQAYDAYRGTVFENVKKTSGLSNVLMLLNEENFVGDIYVPAGYSFSDTNQKLYGQIAGTFTLHEVETNGKEKWKVRMIIRDVRTGKIVVRRYFT